MRGRSTPGVPFAILVTLLALVPLTRPAQAAGPDAAPITAVKFGCNIVGGKLICGVGEKNKDAGNDGDGGDTTKKTDEKQDTEGNAGERSCPPGYIVLDKPNKYGAFCEPADASKSAPPKEAEKCKFGMIGTPPDDCHCPKGTDFQGYKGCVPMKFRCLVKFREKDAGPLQSQTYDYTGIGTEIEVRGQLSQEMDLRQYTPIGPMSCTRIE